MSIADELNHYAGGLGDAYDAVNDMNGVIPAQKNLDNLDTAIRTIPQPTVNDGTLTIQKNGTDVATFTANQASNATANISVPTDTSDLTNTAGFITSADLPTNHVTTDTDQDITGAKNFKNVVKVQNGQGTGSMWIGGNVNSNTVSNNNRHLARISVPSYNNIDLGATLLGFDSSGDADMNVSGKTYDVVSFGGMKKITNATSPMAIGFCIADTRYATAAANKIYALELDADEARFNVQPNFAGVNLATVNDIPGDMTGATSSTAGAHGLVPAPAAGDEGKFLSGAGTWMTVTSGGSYSAGNGINIDSNNAISIDTSVVAEVSDIPTVNDGTLTIQQNGTTVGTFSANQSANETINITSGGGGTTFYADFTTWDPTGDSELYIYKDSAMTQTATNTDLDAALGDGIVYIEDVDRNGEGVFTIVNYNTNTPGGFYSIMEIYESYQLTYEIDTGKFHMTEYELQSKLTAGTNVTISGGTISATDTTYSAFTGATSSVAGTAGLVPAPTTSDPDKYLKGDGTWAEPAAKLVEMSYGESNAWAKFIAAYNAGSIVYCRASSNANPGTGSQTRKAFMAYVNNATSPTSVEFQYVRSVSSKTDSQQCDQVFVYTLTNASGGTWSVASRNMAPKINVSGPITKTFTTGATPSVEIGVNTMTGATSGAAGTAGIVPAPAAGDEAKVLSGAGTWVNQPTVPTVNDATLTITQNGTSAGTFTANASSNATIALTDTTYSDFVGTDGLVAGSAGLVPAPATTDDGKFLKADGTWDSVPSGGWKHILYVDDSQNESPWQTQTYPSWFRIFTDANLTQDLDVNDLQSILADGPTLAAITTVNKPGTTYYAVVNSVVGGTGGQMAYISLTAFDNHHDSSHPAQYLFYMTAAITQTTYYWGASEKTTPVVNNATLTIQHNGSSVQTFTANSSTNKTANIETIYADTVAPISTIGTITTNNLADAAVTNAKIDWSTIPLKIIAAGEISIGTVNANAGKRGWVTIPTQTDTNYAVMLTYSVDATGFATACLNNDLREVSRFEWFVWNFGGSTTGSLKCRYIVVKY